MPNSRKSIYHNKIFIVMCTLACIYNSGYALSTIFAVGIYIDIIFGLLFIFPVILTIVNNKLNMLISSLLLLIFMIIVTFFTSGFTGPVVYISLITKIIFAFGIVLVYKFEDIVDVFLKVMVFISIIALLGYYLLNYTELLASLPIMNSINNVSYGVGYLFYYITYIPQRNCGIFWEPGIFASFLIIAMIFELNYKKEKPSIFKLALFVISIITTKSTAGYGLLLFIAFFIVMNKLNIKVNKRISSMVMFMVFFVCIVIALNYSLIIANTGLINNEVINRLIVHELKEESRFLAMNYNLKMFMQKPLFGWGFSDAYANIKHVADISTSTFFLNVFGILGVQYTFYWIYGILKNKKNHFFVNFSMLIIFLMILNKESHNTFIFSWCIMFYFIKNIVETKKINKRVDVSLDTSA